MERESARQRGRMRGNARITDRPSKGEKGEDPIMGKHYPKPDFSDEQQFMELENVARKRQGEFDTPIHAVIDLEDATRLHHAATNLDQARNDILESFDEERTDEEAAALMSGAVDSIRRICDVLDAITCDMNASCALGSDLALNELDELRDWRNIKLPRKYAK